MDKKIILTISVLTSRKEDQVRRCLESLGSIREAVPSELIVVDTSEDEHMHAVVSEYADEVVSFHWTRDFAAARNAGLERARGEWFLYLDDDEWFGDTGELIEFFKSDLSREMDGATYIQRNYMNREGTNYRDDDVSRVARLIPGRRFEGRIHEYFEPELGKTFVTESYVEHYGYVFDSYEEKKQHFLRNTQILQELIREEPREQRWWVHLAQEYISMRDYENMRRIADEGLAFLGDDMDAESVRSRGTFYMSRILSYVEKAQSEKLIEEGQAALGDTRISRLCRACIRWWMAHSCFWLEKYAQCTELLDNYLEDYDYYRERPTELANDRTSIGVSSCFERVRVEECYELLICAGLKDKNERYLVEYVDKLDFSLHGNFYEDEFFGIIRDLIPELAASRELAELLDRIRRQPDSWRRFCESCRDWIINGDDRLEAVIDICGQAGHRRSICDYRAYLLAERRLSAGFTDESDEEIKQTFTQFMTGVLGYCEAIYGPDFRENDALPSEVLAGLLLEQAFENESDEEIFAASLGQFALICPQFGDAAEMLLARYRAERQEKGDKAREELMELRIQVLGQAKTLIAEGQRDSAVAILEQLLGIFPGDKEIIGLRDELAGVG